MGTREACMPKGDMSANCKCRAVKAATPPRTVPDSNPPGHPTSTVSTVWETTASLGSFNTGGGVRHIQTRRFSMALRRPRSAFIQAPDMWNVISPLIRKEHHLIKPPPHESYTIAEMICFPSVPDPSRERIVIRLGYQCRCLNYISGVAL